MASFSARNQASGPPGSPSPLPSPAAGLAAAGRWARQFVPRPRARLRLFCFPYAGAGAGALRRWMGLFPDDIEVRPIEYPGRWTRQDEPCCDRIADLADGATQALLPLLDLPFAVLGYSMGALVAFEWVRRLERTGQPRPVMLFSCSRRAPHLPTPPLSPPLDQLPDDLLLRVLEGRTGPAPGPRLDDPDLLAMAMRPLRADMRALEAYEFEPGPPLGTPISAFGGDGDPSVAADDLAGWRGHTLGNFTERLFAGGHFFIATEGQALRDAIVGALAPATH